MVQKIKVATWIKSNGEMTQVVPSEGDKFTPQEVQKMVGGLVERLRLPGRMVLLLNEEGIPKGLPLNPRASEMVGMEIFGDVVLVPSGMGW